MKLLAEVESSITLLGVVTQNKLNGGIGGEGLAQC
jgi:hypothetical protein